MSSEVAGELLDRLERGEASALEGLFAAYESYLRAVVRSQLSDRLRAKVDSVDVVQSVWVQVLRRLDGDGWRINGAGHLRALLVTIARRRLMSRARQCPDRGAPDPAAGEVDAAPDARHAAPGDLALANDLWERMLALTPPEHHPVLALRREGLPLAEIAARVGMHEGSVRRVLRRLARELALEGEAGSPDMGSEG